MKKLTNSLSVTNLREVVENLMRNDPKPLIIEEIMDSVYVKHLDKATRVRRQFTPSDWSSTLWGIMLNNLKSSVFENYQ